MFYKFLLVVFSFLLLSVIGSESLNSQETKKVIVYGGDQDSAPFEFIGLNGEPRGYFIEVLRAVGDELGYEFEFVLKDWQIIYNEFSKEKGINLIPLYFDPAKMDEFEFSQNIGFFQYQLLARTEAPIFEGKTSMKGKTVILLANEYLENYFAENYPFTRLHKVKSDNAALELLASGQGDFAVVDDFKARSVLYIPEFSNLRAAGPPFLPIYMVFAAHKEDSTLIQEIDQGLERLKKRRELGPILNKWFATYVPKKYTQTVLLLRYLLWGVGAILIILLAAIIWITLLRKLVNEKTEAIQLELEHKDTALSEVKKANKELDKFVYSISHDINAPIASVLGLINIMKHDFKGPKVVSYISKIENSTLSLKKYINDVLDFSRNTRMILKYEQIDFKSLIGDSVKMLKFLPGAPQITLDQEIKATNPFYSDLYRLKVIFNNILSNAIKYADLSKTKPFIYVKISVSEKDAVLVFEDNGIGIHKSDLDKIFTMFYRASEQSQGSGIGLYIVKEILIKLKGSIQVESEEGKGTAFTIFLPNEGHDHTISDKENGEGI
ncbi:ATP-binding protein [Xanthovirga aplysinae]|uniref:ATP-binding protein n=1 Tax=Xanthovirga aplysinae TaxID=2529853 RepID=UPI0012BBBE1A|nr:transporter substrate-binding domain-containing protein [Xanthovirga aplysinae]MTI30383.1 transporter substrate-binding domain-containing protein [Xanthovirga aplysinae]